MMIDVKNAEIVNMDNAAKQVTFKLSPFYYNSLLLFPAKNNYVRLRIGKVVKARTTGEDSQNHHINGHIQQIAIDTGNNFDDMKTACKYEAISRGYPFRTIRGRVIPYSETEIDTIQAGYLIDTIHQIAAEMGIKLREGEDGR